MGFILVRLRYILCTLKYRYRKNIITHGWCDYLNAEISVANTAQLEIGKMSSARSGTKIYVRDGGKLRIGDGVTFNHNCMIVVRGNVTIGAGTIFGPGVFIYDHDHDYKSNLEMMNSNYQVGDISIGKKCWIAANVGILKNTNIGDGCVVAAGTILFGTYGDNQLIYNDRRIISKPIQR